MRISICACLIAFSLTVDAQTREQKQVIRSKSNVRELERLSVKYKKEYDQLMDYGRKMGWIDENGFAKEDQKEERKRFLIGITPDRKPIYGTALDQYVVYKARAESLYSGGSLGLNVHGEGMTSAVFEPAYVYTANPLFENRVTQVDLPNPPPSISGSWDHATHVTGIIANSNTMADVFLEEHHPLQPGRSDTISVLGVAYKSNVRAFQRDNDQSKTCTEAANGLLVANYSYEASVDYDGRYGLASSRWDSIMVKAPYFLGVFAVGNAGLGSSTPHPVGDQLTNINKNGVAVGCAGWGPNTVSAVPSSSAGPTDDGRIKPDLVSNGSFIYSAVSPFVTGRPLYTQGIAPMSGTSMAAPGVTGVVLLMQQHFYNLYGRFMRSATVKGLLINSAREHPSTPGPNAGYGWGVVDAKKGAETISGMGRESLIFEDSIAQSGVYKKQIIADGSGPILATICWTDPAGTYATTNNDPTPRLVNDLDIRITSVSDSSVYFPWKLNESNLSGPAIQGDNYRDNVEKIYIPNPGNGQSYILSVTHKGTLVNSGQRFSLIVTGLKDCVGSKSIAEDVNGLEPDHQEASQKITLNNEIFANSEAIYHAGGEVLFTDGFTARANSTFRAYIESCTNDYGARKGIYDTGEVTTYNNPRLPLVGDLETEEHTSSYIFPNPNSGIFSVKLGSRVSGFYEISDQMGHIYLSNDFEDSDTLDLNIESYTPGIYLLRVKLKDSVIVHKIIKK